MRNRIFLTSGLFIIVALAGIISGCNSGGGGGSTDNGGKTATPCGPDQQLKEYTAAWIYYNCGPFDNVYIYPHQQDMNGVALGATKVGKGMVSLKYTGLLNEFMYRTPVPTFGLFFMAYGNNQQEVNWQWFSSRITTDAILSTLRSQRFDGNCPGQDKCEKNESTTKVQFLDDRVVYQWDCWWDDTDSLLGIIQCTVTDVTNKRSIVTLSVQTVGAYNGLSYMGFGKNAFDGIYPGYYGVVSDLKITIFQ